MPPSPSGTVDPNEVESSRLALERAFDSLREAVDSCTSNFNRLVNELNEYSWLLGPVPMHFIRNHMDGIRDALKLGLDLAEKVLQNGGPIFSLFLRSLDYLHAAKAPVSDISFDINTPQDDNLNYWSGAAASAYRSKQATQKLAADKVAENAEAISKWLFTIGKTNVAYATELVSILVDATTELVNVTIDAGSLINIQFALDHLAEAVKELIQAGLDQLVQLANKFVATIGDARDLLSQRADHGAFEDGRWPQAVYK